MKKPKVKKCWTKKHGIRKKLDIIPTHPNKYTDSELFWKNLTQYWPTTLIGILHYNIIYIVLFLEDLKRPDFLGTVFFPYRMRFSCRIPQKWLMVSCQRRACQPLWLALKEAARKTRSSGCKQALFWVWVKLLGYCFGVYINNLMGQNMNITVYLPMEFYNIVYSYKYMV